MNILRWYDIVPLVAATAAVVIAILWNRLKKSADESRSSTEE
jgi:hypothetical protein